MEWLFNSDGMITTRSKISPFFKIANYDKYICFHHDVHTHFCFLDNREEMEITKPDPFETIRYVTKEDAGGFVIRNHKLSMQLSIDKKLYECGMYTTKNMMEIKCKDYKPRHAEFSEMVIKAI